MNKTTLLLLLLLPIFCFAQQEQSIWYFGQNTGLDFTNDSPVVLSKGSMSAKGGGATMVDAFGNLLFYTDGVRVWNKNHQLMANGTGLKGNPDVTQTVIIVPKPLNRNKYFIFTVDARQQNAPNALRYSEVDMTLQGGLGEVVQKNVLLLEDVAEKVTATLHYNNQDFWLLTHTWDSNTFYAYKIDSTGVGNLPVKTDIGSIYTGTLTTHRGSFRFNANFFSNKLVVTLPDLKIFELTSLDIETGKMIGFVNLASLSEKAAYVEFNTWNSTRLYTVSTKGDEIFEFNYNSSDEAFTKSTFRSLAKGTNFGDLRLAPDGLVYVVSSNSNTLHSIEWNLDLDNPVYYGEPSIFKANAISVAPNRTLEGLPNTINNYTAEISGIATGNKWCLENSIPFFSPFPNSVDSILWNFDDPASGAFNFS